MKRKISIILLLIATLMFSLLAFTACKKDNVEEGEKQVPVYQGMTITKSNSVLSLASYRMSGITLLSANNENNSDNGNHYGHYKGDHTDRDEDIDEENPYPDNDENENIEEEIKSSLNVVGSPDTIYYAEPNQDIYINIHIDNPDSFEIMSFTLNGKKYSSYMFEEGSDMETIVLKYNVGNVAGIIEYTIDAIKYIDGTKIKDVIIDGNKTVMAGVKTQNQVSANISNLNIGTNSLAFDANIKDNNALIEFSKGALKAVLYDGFSIVAEKDLVVGDNTVNFDRLKTNTLYQYAVVGYYDNLSGDGFGMNVLYKDAFYTDSVVLFDNITVGQENISFSFLWHEDHQGKAISALKLYKGDMFVKDLTANVTTVNELLSGNTYKLVAEYPNSDKTESIYLEFTTLAKVAPEISVNTPTSTQTSVGFTITETDIDNVGAVTKIELVHANGTVEATSLDQRTFANLLSNNEYTVRVTYTYNLNDGEGEHTITSELAITTLAKAVPSFAVKNENVTTDSVTAEYDIIDVDKILSYYKVELYKGNTLVLENANKKIDFTGLDCYTNYTVKITCTYDLNDGNGEQTKILDCAFKTLPYIDVTECSIANTSAVSEGETIFMSVKLDNPLGMSIESVVINGETYNVTGASTKNKIFVEIVYNGQFAGGDTYLKIDKVNAKIDNTTLSIEPKTELSDNVFINGKLEVLKIEFVNDIFEPIDWAFPSDVVYVLITLDNPTGYTIDNINTDVKNLVKIDNNRWYYPINLSNGWNEQSLVNINYHNEYIVKTLTCADVDAFCYQVVSNEIKYISTPSDLKDMNDGYYYELANDINLLGYEWLGSEFHGVFDGKGYAIKNMSFVGTIKNRDAYLGLFSQGIGIVQNINIQEALVMAEIISDNDNDYDAYCGSIIAQSKGIIVIKKCFVDDSSSFSVKNFAGISFVSGILGQTWHHTQISQCSTGATIYAYALDEDWYSQAYAGGIIGSVCRANNYSNAIAQIINCNNYGTIFADSLYSSEYSGGLIAHGAKCQIQFSINIGTVKSGALVDAVYYNSIIKNSLLVGTMFVDHCYESLLIEDSYVFNNYLNCGEGYTKEDLNSKEFYTETLGWSEDVWDFSDLDVENGKYPKLKQ